MIYANKKVSSPANNAKLTAEIIAKVKGLLAKNLIKLNDGEVLLYPQIWKDRQSAENWMKCLHFYCTIKKLIKKQETLRFKNMETGEIIGQSTSNSAKILYTITDQ